MAGKVFSAWAAIMMWSFIFSPSLGAEIFKWVDSNGTTHYSDQHFGVKIFQYVGESELITYSKKSGKDSKIISSVVSPYPKNLSKRVRQPRKAAKNYSSPRVGGSSSKRSYSRGNSRARSSYGGSSGRRY